MGHSVRMEGRVHMGRTISQVKRQFHYRKPICPFIGSTFADFQDERDILVKKVFPAVDALCRERGTYCAPVDLRWGIHDSQVSAGFMIQLCLDYVHKSAPFFISLIGERYGAHRHEDTSKPLPHSYEELPPDADWMDRNFLVAASSGYEWVLQDAYQHASVTELEIIQAAFLEDTQFGFFYFRQSDHVDNLFTDLPEEERKKKLKIYESESEYSALKLKDLKARIVKKGLPIRYYKTPEDLARIALEDWMGVVNNLYPPLEDLLSDQYTERFKEWMAHETYAETRRRAFVKSSEITNLFTELTEFALSALEEPPGGATDEEDRFRNDIRSTLRKTKSPIIKYQSTLLLVGERGCGKTSVVANWVKEFTEENPGVKIYAHYVGSGAISADSGALMRRCSQELRGEYHDSATSAESEAMSSEEITDYHHVCEAFAAALSLGPCILVIDGIDELIGSYGQSPQQVKEMSWLPLPLPPQCKIVMTTASSDLTCKVLRQRSDTKVVSMPLLQDSVSRCNLIQEHLAMHCKSLTQDQLDRIVSCKLSNKPLFLTTLANELRVFGVYTRLDYHLDSYLDSTSIRDLWSRIIQRWIKDYSWTTNAGQSDGSQSDNHIEIHGWVADSLRLIACSRNGLSQAEILNILKQLDYEGEARVTSSDWALFQSAAMDALFERPGGLLGFSHQHFREAVEYSLLGAATPDIPSSSRLEPPAPNPQIPQALLELLGQARPSTDRRTFHRHLADYFLKQTHSARRTDELPWQLMMHGDDETLLKIVGDPSMFLDLHGELAGSRRLELLHYWKVLIKAGYNAGDTYQQMIEQLVQGNRLKTEIKDDKSIHGDSESSDEELQLLRIPETKMGSFDLEESSDDDELKVPMSRKNSRASLTRSITPESMMSHVSIGNSGRMRIAQLCKYVGQFLVELNHFHVAEDVLLDAHDKINDHYPLDEEELRLLCGIEESLADLYLQQDKKSKAMKWYNKARNSIEAIMEGLTDAGDERLNTETKGRLLDRLGDLHTREYSFGEAERLLKRAERCMTHAESITGKATVKYHMGRLRMYQRRFLEAEDCMRQAKDMREKWYGRSHPLVAEILNDLATLLSNRNNNQSFDKYEAEALYKKSLEIREQCLGADHLLVARTLVDLGKLLKQEDSPPAKAEAMQFLQRALDLRTTNLGADHNLTRQVRRVLSDLESSLKDHLTNQVSRSIGTGGAPFSSMSWRDDDLVNIAQRVQSQTGRASRASSRDLPSENLPPQSTIKNKLIARQISLRGRSHSEPRLVVERRKSAPVKREEGPASESEDVQEIRPQTRLGFHIGYPDSFEIPRVNVDGVDSELLEFEDNVLENKLSFGTKPKDKDKETEITEEKKVESKSGNTSVTPDKDHFPAYLDTYAKELGQMEENKEEEKNVKEEESKQDTPHIRPQSAIYKYSKKQRGELRPKSASNLANTNEKQLLEKRQRARSATLHHQRCYIPGSHSIDIHNAYSVMHGTHSSITSLVEAPLASRPLSRTIHHTSAWYHVPGRYPTHKNPYPPKRSQSRIPSTNIYPPGSLQDMSQGQGQSASSWPMTNSGYNFELGSEGICTVSKTGLTTSMPNFQSKCITSS